jgi:hypothetical protein
MMTHTKKTLDAALAFQNECRAKMTDPTTSPAEAYRLEILSAHATHRLGEVCGVATALVYRRDTMDLRRWIDDLASCADWRARGDERMVDYAFECATVRARGSAKLCVWYKGRWFGGSLELAKQCETDAAARGEVW